MIRQQRAIARIAHRTFAWCRLGLVRLLSAAFLVTFAFGAAAPIKIGIFAFELEDYSAGASSNGQIPADTIHLENVTDEVRKLVAQSGRYDVIDVGRADADAVKSHTLRECDGCDAAIALELGAQQSFVGVVKRISRTEYTVKYRIRDAHTGIIVADEESELRMGADYSWSRGATRLVKDRLLTTNPQP